MTADLSVWLDFLRFRDLRHKTFFNTAKTDGDCVLWGYAQPKRSVREFQDVALIGKT